MLYVFERLLKEPDSVCDKLPADGTVVHLLCTVPAESVSTQEGGIVGLCQADGTVARGATAGRGPVWLRLLWCCIQKNGSGVCVCV